jgi:hypothetical protein
MDDLQTALAPLDDIVVRSEIGRFATALRQSVALHVPLFLGDIWASPQAQFRVVLATSPVITSTARSYPFSVFDPELVGGVA